MSRLQICMQMLVPSKHLSLILEFAAASADTTSIDTHKRPRVRRGLT